MTAEEARSTAARERPILLHAAGSLRAAFEQLLPAFERAHGQEVQATFGPAGLLRERIERGEPADLFASANMAHPNRLFELGLFDQPVCFARNRICVLARRDLGLTTENLVDKLLDPAVKLGTSTPQADPSGDYAQTVFERIDLRRPGAGAVLKDKARHLVGGAEPPAVPKGRIAAEWLIATGEADVFLSYWTSALPLAGNASLAVIELPPQYSVVAEYGLAAAMEAAAAAFALKRFIRSTESWEILRSNGFMPPIACT
ncbi:molybdate ABC transporter substrate-binding protein [Bosea caraganae]|uniref:Molybdate ABC transporter substrate-binding protein n=1 Tax=Bosea caraganae TaxID=2763117 RepID=A0A370L0K0_9HYPH|nr:molybdate ABC transporter substrate-binding protein [Bosea caraganae]RDJ20382.1 molybdate ABC transporter substrate-binding protein [Bosea caraganae]RDJ26537.1 molybdate ABC transporter substrate-binding protein [Bosea caraganae]